MSERTAAQAASDYFNALPFEQRRRLAPLLDDYRRMGIEEALVGLRSVTNGLTQRVRGIATALDAPAPDDAAPLNQHELSQPDDRKGPADG